MTGIGSLLQEHRTQGAALKWEGSFGEYFDLVVANPRVARLSHARIHDMIADAGVEDGRYKFFDTEIFGSETAIAQLMEYFRSAGKRLEVRKRILLMVGPVGGGKSTIATMLKRGMEKYSETADGAVYAIQGCPMHEEPLHLIPDDLRPKIAAEHGLYIEGDLCPVCRDRLDREFGGDPEQFRVERVVFSERKRVGIGTFVPSDEKALDISALVGSMDLSKIGKYGSESDPRAYRFDGEFNVANRGAIEMIEMLKLPREFLYGLLTLAQEQQIKTNRFAMLYADEAVISHTNEVEFKKFMADGASEALHDRVIVVKVPYNLRVTDEIKIYDKLVKQGQVGAVHIAPQALRAAATFAVLSRLEQPKKAGVSLVKKMKLYDGEAVDSYTERDVKEIKEDAEREGMDGISPRYIINRISAALVKDGTKCVNPIDVMRALKEGVEQMDLKPADRDRYKDLLGTARELYDEQAKKEVQKAFVYAYDESASTLFNNYLDNVEAYCYKQKIKDPLTGEDVEPDEKLMRSLEEAIGVYETAAKTFREEILQRQGSVSRRGQKFDYKSHERLREAIEKKLFNDLRDVVKITTSTKTPDAEQLKRINGVVERLIAEHGYCEVCANELLKYVGTLLNR